MKPAPASASLGNRKINVLLVGGGGREHALAWKLKQSSSLGALFTTHPENPGLAKLCRPCDVPLDPREIVRLKAFCDREKIGLVVIGPEHYLAQGMADALASPTTVVFGPGKEAAQLETDKWWAKELMRGASIPTAEARVFRDAENAKSYLISRTQPLVIKASGLAGGKGVVVGQTVKECIEAVDRMMVRREFGDAGSTIIAEERLEGREVSVFALVDGRNVVILDPCQDHKRLLDNDEGPNTGGMGAFCPSNALDARTMAIVQREIIVPTIDALRRDTIDFRGVLYVGLMLTPAGPKVLEYNVRFGDPECQCLVRRIEGDWVKLLLATAGGQLDRVEFESSSEHVCCIVLAGPGYPATPAPGGVIRGVDEAEKLEGITVFHAGTKLNAQGELVAVGGRVLDVVATGKTLDDARARALEACAKISFEGMQYRRDIGVVRVEAGGRAKRPARV